jgi:thiosulfate/3-mercaptopyruvate sulfurtransferase
LDVIPNRREAAVRNLLSLTRNSHPGITILRMNHRNRIAAILLIAGLTIVLSGFAYQASTIEASHLIDPEDVAKILQSPKGEKPLLIQVGFHVLYLQGHIPGSEYIGPASDATTLQKLRDRAQSLPRNKFIVIYCGCCPWDHCPNLKPAHDALLALGFTNVKALHIPNNIATDWRDKGYSTTKGE